MSHMELAAGIALRAGSLTLYGVAVGYLLWTMRRYSHRLRLVVPRCIVALSLASTLALTSMAYAVAERAATPITPRCFYDLLTMALFCYAAFHLRRHLAGAPHGRRSTDS
jgi:hypothetical protein